MYEECHDICFHVERETFTVVHVINGKTHKSQSKVKVEFSLCLIKHHALKRY
jgi:hypothetical protein